MKIIQVFIFSFLFILGLMPLSFLAAEEISLTLNIAPTTDAWLTDPSALQDIMDLVAAGRFELVSEPIVIEQKIVDGLTITSTVSGDLATGIVFSIF